MSVYGLDSVFWKVILKNLTPEAEAYIKMSFAENRKETLKDGITLFAWWKDGTQYVGTCGTTLKEALEKIDKGEIK